jgi:hypothetical protein
VATITDPELIKAVIENHGFYPGDEQSPAGPIVRIVEYRTPEGALNWGVVYLSEVAQGLLYRYDEPSGYVLGPVVIYARPL